MGELADEIRKWCREHKPEYKEKCPCCGNMFTHFGFGNKCPDCERGKEEAKHKKNTEENKPKRDAEWTPYKDD